MHRPCPANGVGVLTQVFLRFSETLTDVVNAMVGTDILVLSYSAISEIPETVPPPPHTLDNLTHIDCYMDEFISAVQGGLYFQH